jgi:hypothetical protein
MKKTYETKETKNVVVHKNKSKQQQKLSVIFDNVQTDDELYSNLKILFDEIKSCAKLDRPTRQLENEICYFQNELMLRSAQRNNHVKYLAKLERIEQSERSFFNEDDLFHMPDNVNKEYVELWELYSSNKNKNNKRRQ